ncbi:MAG: vitamin K epoxide reductase family protein [Thermoplasmata archaeon]
MRTRTLRSVVYVAAGLGLIVALFATAEYFDAALRGVCSVSSFFSCSLVDSSGLTATLGIPDYLWGTGGFIAILVVAALAERRPHDRRLTYALLGVTSLGVALSLWLLYVELALIHALCPVCATDYVLVGVAWAGAMALAWRSVSPRDDEGRDDDDDAADDRGHPSPEA